MVGGHRRRRPRPARLGRGTRLRQRDEGSAAEDDQGRHALRVQPMRTLLGAALLAAVGSAPAPVLRVCADPNNLPFSNASRQGFENKLAELVAHELGTRVAYTWWAQRRGFLR